MAAPSSANVLTWNSWAPSFWSAYIVARASLNASIASMRFCKTWTRQVRRRTSAEITRSAMTVFNSFMRAETGSFANQSGAIRITWLASSGKPKFSPRSITPTSEHA